MKKRMIICALCLAIASPLFAQKKEEERLSNSATVFRAILAGPLPTNILDQASCVLIFPSVKKVAIGIGGSYGRGALVCRGGADMNGAWGTPAMYKLDQASIGVQLGSTATDFVLVVMSQRTKLAAALRASEIQYDTHDLSENDRRFWQRSKEAADELLPDFVAEGNEDLAHQGETNAVLDFIRDGRHARYLYHAEVP